MQHITRQHRPDDHPPDAQIGRQTQDQQLIEHEDYIETGGVGQELRRDGRYQRHSRRDRERTSGRERLQRRARRGREEELRGLEEREVDAAGDEEHGFDVEVEEAVGEGDAAGGSSRCGWSRWFPAFGSHSCGCDD